MTALDWGLLVIVALSALLGLARGLIGVAMSLAAWLLAGVAAFLYGDDVGRSLGNSTGWYVGGYALCFAMVWIGVGIIGMVVRRIAHSYGLSEIDRLMGLGLGLLRGVVLACALMLFLAMTSLPREPTWQGSMLAGMLMPGAELMRSALPDAIARKIDLEGNGTSLQDTVQAQARSLERELENKLESQLPKGDLGSLGGLGGMLPAGGGQGQGQGPRGQALPQPLPEDLGRLSDALPKNMRDLLPGAAQGGARGTGAQVRGDPSQVGAQPSDDKQVH